MEHELMELVTGGQVAAWILIAFLVGYFVYKEWPDFQRRMTGRAVEKERDAAADKTVNARLSAIEDDVRQIKEKLERDFTRLNTMERWKKTITGIAEDSLEERQILMEAMLGVLGGLQEIGANGCTKSAETTIRNYLNRKAHDKDDTKVSE